MDTSEIIEKINDGAVGVLPTDTLYGLVCSARIPEAVERVYTLKKRDPAKPLIVLISEIESVEEFGVVLSDELRAELSKYWPGPYSIVLPTIDETFEYLGRGTGTIAFRLPANDELVDFLKEAGPIVAPSANREGETPSRNVKEAKSVFGDDVAFYVDGGDLSGEPSTVLRLDDDGAASIVRKGRN